MIRLRLVRQSRGITQVQLCGMTGISPADISAIEIGRRPAFPSWRKRIADALGIGDDADWLFEEVAEDEAAAQRA